MSFEVEYRMIARWFLQDPDVIRKFQNDMCTQAHHFDQKQLSPVMLEFKKVIEEDAGIFRDFHEIFEQVRPNKSNQRSVSTYPGGR